jgi:7,8-dihydropterin-6-yl-methyl-4-(beta-D-ribofuranosyl)aminobenzene 5'-phosphate synthase
MIQSMVTAGSTVQAEQEQVRLHVVFNNLTYKTGLQTGWGFACLIEGLDKVVLFDTGGNGDFLLSNMQQLGLYAEAVEAVVLSHIHGDHTGGLESFPASFKQEVIRLGAAIETVSQPQRLFDSVFSTGEMGGTTKEQALIVDTPRGLIVITGCAYPDVADMVERAKDYLGKHIFLLMGGFHLGGRSESGIRTIIKRLKALGVKKVAPSHCTGNTAIRLFRDAWKDDFIEGGLGAVIEVPR